LIFVPVVRQALSQRVPFRDILIKKSRVGVFMKEITRKNWNNIIEQSCEEPFFLYLETPLCGTCKVGKRMFEVAVAAMEAQSDHGKSVKAGYCNINSMPELAEKYGITSVPCLLILSRGIAAKQMYALESAGKIYQTMIEALKK
jgi:thioredoxin-like negative regulator of GroEL